ncbi:MAG: class I SAM-dependent methyltransferase [Nitrospirae bacterium]|nr:class I SAM-dependent methyltransferase [Nitrospirota bacterium]
MDRLSRQNTTSAAEAFSLHAEEYDKWFDSAEGRVLFPVEHAAVLLLMKNLVPPFLEIGTGSGRFAKALGISYGVDPSRPLVAMARGRGINVEQAFGEKLPYANSLFGGVFILFTLCFANDPQKVIAEACRVLKKDGGMVIGLINRESPWGKLYMQKQNEGHPIYKHAHFLSTADVASMLKSADMKVEGYSSALLQLPSEDLQKEEAREGLVDAAGFVCILARKT